MGKVQVEADIPQIVNYVATTVTVGNTTILAPGQPATVTNSGTPQNAILNFGIPSTSADFQEYRKAADQDIIDATKQPKTLSTAITVNGVSKTTVEDALNAINENTAIADTDLSNLTATGEAKFDAKANTSLSNLDDAGKIVGSTLSMPSTISLDMALAASTTTYTAPSTGWIYISGTQYASSGYVFLENVSTGLTMVCQPSNVSSFEIRAFIPVIKGQTFRVSYGDCYIYVFKFIYAEGSKSEAS